MAAACPGMAQVSLDGSLGAAGALAGPNFQVTADFGQRRGANLFHSFSHFSLANGETATFSGPGEVQNILSRVTGGGVSQIDGTIRSTIPGANLFLVNPAGVLFGPNAAIDISGSLAVSTADYLKLVDGGRFDAKAPEGTVLTAAPIEAFGFLGPKVAGIKIEGSRLSVIEGKSISVAGGDIGIKGAEIWAPGGRLNLASVKSANEVSHGLHLQPADLSALGDIQLTGGSVVNVGGGSQPVFWDGRESDPIARVSFPRGVAMGSPAPVTGLRGGGTVSIRGGNLSMDGSALYQTTEGDGTGGGFDIRLAAELSLQNKSHVLATALGPGRGGDVRVEANNIGIEQASHLDATTAGAGRGGDVVVRANRSIEFLSGGISTAMSYGLGAGGQMDFKAESVRIDSLGAPTMTAIVSQSLARPLGGNAGNVRVETTGPLEIQNRLGGAIVAVGSRSLTSASGNIDIKAGSVSLDGGVPDQSGLGTATFITTLSFGGPVGTIRIEADRLMQQHVNHIFTQTSGPANAGDVVINVREAFLGYNSLISSITCGSSGNAGNVLFAADRLSMEQFGKIRAFSCAAATGNSGSVDIEVGSLSLRSGARIGAETETKGHAGVTRVKAGSILIDGRDEPVILNHRYFTGITSETGAFTHVREPGAEVFGGLGGEVFVEADSIQIFGASGSISASTKGPGNGGNVQVKAGRLGLFDGGNISSSSAQAGDSGHILIEARDPIVMNGAAISTAAAIGNAGGSPCGRRRALKCATARSRRRRRRMAGRFAWRRRNGSAW